MIYIHCIFLISRLARHIHEIVHCCPQIADPSSLSDVALAYVRARNADPMCRWIGLHSWS